MFPAIFEAELVAGPQPIRCSYPFILGCWVVCVFAAGLFMHTAPFEFILVRRMYAVAAWLFTHTICAAMHPFHKESTEMFDHRQEHVDDGMILIQANLDDMNPEYSSYVMDRLFEAGANDVYWVPIVMKRGRPGLMLNVLVDERLLEEMERIIFAETTTLGIRYMRASCHRLGREFVKAETRWGPVTVKVGYYKGKIVQASPEFKECEQVAKKNGVPLKMVYEEVRRAFLGGDRERDRGDGGGGYRGDDGDCGDCGDRK